MPKFNLPDHFDSTDFETRNTMKSLQHDFDNFDFSDISDEKQSSNYSK